MQRIKVIVPIAIDEAGLANRASQRSEGPVRPGLRPEFEAVRRGAVPGDCCHDTLLTHWTVLQAGITAKAQGPCAVEEDGAGFIVLGATAMHQSAACLQSELPVPVINPVEVAHKVLKSLIEPGLAHSKKALPPPEVPRQAGIRKGWC